MKTTPNAPKSKASGSLNLQHFTLRLRHDKGYISIRTVAKNEQAAREQVCAAERCPDSSVRRVYHGRCL